MNWPSQDWTLFDCSHDKSPLSATSNLLPTEPNHTNFYSTHPLAWQSSHWSSICWNWSYPFSCRFLWWWKIICASVSHLIEYPSCRLRYSLSDSPPRGYSSTAQLPSATIQQFWHSCELYATSTTWTGSSAQDLLIVAAPWGDSF